MKASPIDAADAWIGPLPSSAPLGFQPSQGNHLLQVLRAAVSPNGDADGVKVQGGREAEQADGCIVSSRSATPASAAKACGIQALE